MTEHVACYLLRSLELINSVKCHIEMVIVKLEMKGQIKHTALWDVVLEYFSC